MTEAWINIVPPFKILSIWAFLRSNGKNFSIFFIAIGKPKINTLAQLIQTTLLFVIIYPLMINFGLFGVSVALLISALVIFSIRIYIFIHITNFKIINLLKPIFIQLIFAFLSMFSVFAIKPIFFNLSNGILIILSIILFTIFYLFLNYIADKYFKYKIFKIIKEIFYSLKN